MRIRLFFIVAVALLSVPAVHAFCFGTIHVHVFRDTNGNGVLDSGEPGVSGVTVQLDQLADGTVEDTRATDANGDADFFAPAVVIYRVRIIPPAGAVQTSANPPDMFIVCNGVTNVSFAVVQAAPALSGGILALLGLALAGIAVVVIRR